MAIDQRNYEPALMYGAQETIVASVTTALNVGPNGSTNPAFQVDDSATSSATGLKVKSNAAGSGVAVSAISSGSAENLTIDAKGSGTITLAGTSTGAIVFGQALTVAPASGLDTSSAGTLLLGPTVATGVQIGGTAVTSITTSETVAGTIQIGSSTSTGTFTFGNSTAAAGQTIQIDSGNAGGSNSVNIGTGLTSGAGSKTINLANGNNTSGTVTVNIANGNTTVAGGVTVNLANGTPSGSGTNIVNIGSNANVASTTLIQGGNSGSAIQIIPQTTGVITIGASAGTGNIVVGSSSSSQNVLIGNGAGAATVNIANVSTAGSTVTMVGAATATGNTDTVSIATGNVVGTGKKVVNIGTGTPANPSGNQITLGNATNTNVSLKGANISQSLTSNLISSETGANNAIVGGLNDAGSNPVPLATGLRVTVILAHSLQAGANTFNYNAGGALAIKSHLNPANNIASAYASTGIIDLLYNGTLWLDMAQ